MYLIPVILACVASVSVWFRSKERPRNGILRLWNKCQKIKTPFFARSLTLVSRSLLLNRTETLATQATVISIIVSLGFWFIIVIIIPFSIEVIIVNLSHHNNNPNQQSHNWGSKYATPDGWKKLEYCCWKQRFGSDVAAVVRLAVALEGHLNIVCGYQEQAARTWVPAVVHVHGCSHVDNCFDNGQANHIHNNMVGHLLVPP